jgi:hypothetical protein
MSWRERSGILHGLFQDTLYALPGMIGKEIMGCCQRLLAYTGLWHPRIGAFGLSSGPDFGIGQIFAITQIQLQHADIVNVCQFVRQYFGHFVQSSLVWCAAHVP